MMHNQKKVTLAVVAAQVGVSAITVSRALHNPDKVSPELLTRIQKAVAELGYVPNSAARALASNRSNVIGVLIPSISNQVFTDVLLGIYTSVEDSHLTVQIGNSRYSNVKEENLLRTFLSQRPAGLIIAGIDQSETALKLLSTANCPIVQIMDYASEPIDMLVGFSHQQSAKAATQHLIDSGYQHLAFIGARMDARTQRRYQGFQAATEAAGLFDKRRVVTTLQPSTVQLGSQLLQQLLTIAPETDAVFCNNDDLALGVLFEAQRRHLAVPNRLGICGFNDFEMMAAAEPSLTSVRTFRYEMGLHAAQMIIDTLSGQEPLQKVVDLGFEVKQRMSTRRQAEQGFEDGEKSMSQS